MSTFRQMTTALAASLLLASCSVFQQCESPQCLRDAKLRDQVDQQINERSSLRFFNIYVQAYHQDVYLEGVVDTEIDRSNAEQIAQQVPGVKKVYNDLQLEGNGAH